jgi:hypothetical protein
MREMWERVWFLGTRAKWLEKQMKEAEEKVRQLGGESSAGTEGGSLNKKEQDISLGKKRRMQV